METKVDLMAAEIDLAAEVDFVGEKLDSAATELSLAPENSDLVVEELDFSINGARFGEQTLHKRVVGSRLSRVAAALLSVG